jgi:nucleotide-binding universal stress UspA family protein
MIQAHPLGILLGLVFVTALSLLFRWMFRVPPALSLPVVKVRRSLQAIHKILVPVVEAITSERAVELACRLGREQDAELILAHVIVVPYTMPLNAPFPEREKEAQKAIELGSLIAKRYGHPARTRIIRHRRVPDGILQVAREEQVDAIVLGLGVKPHLPGEWGKVGEEILRRAQCEVIVDKVPISEQPLAVALGM